MSFNILSRIQIKMSAFCRIIMWGEGKTERDTNIKTNLQEILYTGIIAVSKMDKLLAREAVVVDSVRSFKAFVCALSSTAKWWVKIGKHLSIKGAADSSSHDDGPMRTMISYPMSIGSQRLEPL